MKPIGIPNPEQYRILINGTECKCPSDCEVTRYELETSAVPMVHSRKSFVKKMKRKGQILSYIEKKINELEMAESACPDITGKTAQVLKEWKSLNKSFVESASLLHFFYKEDTMLKFNRHRLISMPSLIGKECIQLKPEVINHFFGIGKYSFVYFIA